MPSSEDKYTVYRMYNKLLLKSYVGYMKGELNRCEVFNKVMQIFKNSPYKYLNNICDVQGSFNDWEITCEIKDSKQDALHSRRLKLEKNNCCYPFGFNRYEGISEEEDNLNTKRFMKDLQLARDNKYVLKKPDYDTKKATKTKSRRTGRTCAPKSEDENKPSIYEGTKYEELFGTPEKLAKALDKVTFICSYKENRQDGSKCRRWCSCAEFCGSTEEEILEFLKS